MSFPVTFLSMVAGVVPTIAALRLLNKVCKRVEASESSPDEDAIAVICMGLSPIASIVAMVVTHDILRGLGL